MIEAILGPFWQLIAVAVVFVLGILGAWFGGRKSGETKTKQEAKEADHARAETIRDKADAARRKPAGDAVDRLRKHGRLRD